MNNNENNNDLFGMFNADSKKENIEDVPKEDNVSLSNDETLIETSNNSENVSKVNNESFDIKQNGVIENSNEKVVKEIVPESHSSNLEANSSSDLKENIITNDNDTKVSDNNKNIYKYHDDVDVYGVLFNGGSEDELLLSSYIGINYEKIRSGGFNLWAAIFGSLWLLYHKVYSVPIIYGIIYAFLYVFFPVLLNSFLYQIFTFVIFGVFSNPIYLMHAKYKIKKLKQTHPEMSREDLACLCSKEGESGIIPLIKGIGIRVLLTISIYIVLALLGYPINTGIESIDNVFFSIPSLSSKDHSTLDNKQDTTKENDKQDTKAETFIIGGDSSGYEQVLNIPDVWDEVGLRFSTDTSIALKFNLSFPSTFERVGGSQYIYDYVDFGDTSNDFCRLTFVEVDNMGSVKTIKDAMNDYIVSDSNYTYYSSNVIGDNNQGFAARYIYNNNYYSTIIVNDGESIYLYEIINAGNYDVEKCTEYASYIENN